MSNFPVPVLHNILALRRINKIVIRGWSNDPRDNVGNVLEAPYVNPGLPVDLPPGNSDPKD